MSTAFLNQQNFDTLGPELVRAAYQGILGREPDDAGLLEYVKNLESHKEFHSILDILVRSLEAWKRNTCAQPRELARQVVLGLCGFEPSAAYLDQCAADVEANKDLSRFIAKVAADHRPEWQGMGAAGLPLVSAESEADGPSHVARGASRDQQDSSNEDRRGVLLGLFRGIVDREPDEAELLGLVNAWNAGTPFESLTRELLNRQRAARPAQLDATDLGESVRTIYLALLGREPDAMGLQGYVQFLADGGRLVDVAVDIGGSQEHWLKQLADRAEGLVTLTFQALLQRDPDEAALAAYADSMRQHHDLRGLIAELGSSREHREKLLRSVLAQRF